MIETFSFDYFGSTINATSLGITSVPSLEQTLTAHCIPITSDGKIVAVNILGRGIDIPGGHIDDGETAIEAMLRETQEETQITVSNPVLIDIWRLSSGDDKLGLAQKPYLLLYTASVESIDVFDANDEADERFILEPDDFVDRYFGDKGQARIMIDRALNARK